jgi:protocatechuate 3,4-dioxygenase beta subunit
MTPTGLSIACAVAALAAPAPADRALRGGVTAADGSPASAAVVWAARLDFGTPLQRVENRADDQGRFALALGPGRWYVWARLGTQGAEAGRREPLVIPERGTPAPLALRLEERGRLRGRLLDAETGQPLPGGRLTLDNAVVLTADGDGRFEFGGLSRTHHEAFAVCPGHARLRVLFDTTARADTQLDVPLPRAGKAVGRVTDQSGQPIPGASIGVLTSGNYFSTNALFERCDDQGRFDFDGIAFDRPARLAAFAPGFADQEQEGWRVADGEPPPELTFRLSPRPTEKPDPVPANDGKPHRTVSGVVRGPGGGPVEGALVRWGVRQTSDALETRTDKAGRFRLPLVPATPGQLAVEAKEVAPAFPQVPAGGDHETAIDLVAGHSVQGMVRDFGKEPFAGVRVVPVIPSPEPGIGNPYWLTEKGALTDARGRFRIDGVPDTATFDFLREGLSDLRGQGLQFDGAGNVVLMTAGGAVRGRVVDAAGRPVRNFRVMVNAPHDRRPNEGYGGYFAGYCGIGVRFTGDDGEFVLTGLVAGNLHRVSVAAEGHGAAVEDRVRAEPLNRLPPAEKLTLRVGPAHTLRVRAVTGKEARPVGRARVTLVNGDPGLDQSFSWGYHDASWEEMARARTGADGWAAFPSLTFGEATVLVEAPGFGRRRLPWRGGQRELTFALEPEAVLTGTVRDGAGRPLAEVYVSLSGDGGDSIGTVTGEGGKFRIKELPAGDYQVLIRSDRRQLHQERVTLKAGETADRAITVAGP